MGNHNNKDNIREYISRCPQCKIPFSKDIERALSVTISNKVYTVHQHGYNVIVSKSYNTIICIYTYNEPLIYDDRNITIKAYDVMYRKVFINLNIIKYLVMKNKFINCLDILPIIIKLWY